MVFHAYHAFPFLKVPQISLQGGPELIRVLLWWWSTKLTTNPNQNMKIAQWGFWASFGPQFSRLPFKVFRVRFWSFAKTWRKTFLWSVLDPQGIYIYSFYLSIYPSIHLSIGIPLNGPKPSQFTWPGAEALLHPGSSRPPGPGDGRLSGRHLWLAPRKTMVATMKKKRTWWSQAHFPFLMGFACLSCFFLVVFAENHGNSECEFAKQKKLRIIKDGISFDQKIGVFFSEMSGLPLRLLDAFARRPLWQDGMEYGHGTGHGIGAYLNVHEGPAQSHGDRIIGFQG